MYMLETELSTENKHWKRKDEICSRVAKRTISTKNMLFAIFINHNGPVAQVPCPSGRTVTDFFYKKPVWKTKWRRFTRRSIQEKVGLACALFMTTCFSPVYWWNDILGISKHLEDKICFPGENILIKSRFLYFKVDSYCQGEANRAVSRASVSIPLDEDNE